MQREILFLNAETSDLNRTKLKLEPKQYEYYFTLKWDARVPLCWTYDEYNSTWYSTIHKVSDNRLSVLFINSDGFGVLVEDSSQLKRNELKLCITPQQNTNQKNLQNSVTIFLHKNIDSVYEVSWGFKKFQQIYPIQDNRVSDYHKYGSVFEHPIWSFSSNAKQFMSNVKGNLPDYDGRKLLLHFDGKWQKNDGDFALDQFNTKELTKQLHEVDATAQISLPVNSFISNASCNFDRLQFMMFKDNNTGKIVIDDSVGGRLDLSQESVLKWFMKKLTKLCHKNKDVSFRLETGKFGSFDANLLFQSKAYLTTQIDTYFEGNCTSAALTNYIPIVQVGQNVDSNTYFQNNLKSLLPIVLSLGLSKQMAHIVPSLVSQESNKPSDELYIRWVQATALMPIMKLSIPPWSYNKTTSDIVQKILELRAEFVPLITDLAKRTRNIVQPMWRFFPDDPKCSTINDQFMLGDEIVVAPVRYVGQRERSVYLPKGIWIDQHDNGYTGPRDFKVKTPLEELPYFTLFQRM